MRRGAFAALILSGLQSTSPAAATEPDTKGAETTVSAVDARARCVAAPPEAAESCSIAEFGEIGMVDGHRFHYAVYQYRNQQNGVLDQMRVVVFEEVSSGMMRAVAMTETDPAITYEKPTVLRSSGRVLLHIPGSESGTGNFNRERLFVWRAGAWRDVDTIAWLDDLVHRLPKGYGVWKGIYPNYIAMTASTPIWREGDGNACPSGGRADLVLGWQGDRIALREVRLRKAGECGEALPKRRGVN